PLPALLIFLVLVTNPSKLETQVFVGSISGVVKDPSGGIVPGAQVTIRNLDTSWVRELRTDENGYYRASGVPLGSYEVQVSAQAFKTEVRTGINLTVERAAVVDFNLVVGTREEKIVVSGEAPFVDAASPALGELVDERRVRALPLNKRDLSQL